VGSETILSLTEDDTELMARVRDEALAAGLSTEPMDREVAKESIIDVYADAGLPPPVIWVYLDSPYAGYWAAQRLSRVWDQVGAQVLAQLWDQAEAQIWDQVEDQVLAQVKDQVGDQVKDQVWDQVGAQVLAQLWDQARAQIWDQVEDQVRIDVWRCEYGQHDSALLSYFEFFRRKGLAEFLAETERLHPLWRIAHSAGWWWPFKGACIITDRPCVLNRDQNHRLHCETGPALLYRDGWGVYAWHGIRVPRKWIEARDSIDPQEILEAPNVEQRAAGVQIVGLTRMLPALNETVIDEHPNPEIGSLIELTLKGLPERGRFLKARCPRNGIIIEGVPRVSDIDGKPIETAIAAQAWRIGTPASEFEIPPIRT